MFRHFLGFPQAYQENQTKFLDCLNVGSIQELGFDFLITPDDDREKVEIYIINKCDRTVSIFVLI